MKVSRLLLLIFALLFVSGVAQEDDEEDGADGDVINYCDEGCLGRGYCQNNECICYPGFSGKKCEIGSCLGNCSGHGHCKWGGCICDDGWLGVDCSYRGCAHNCHNRGWCHIGQDDVTCHCLANFTGKWCGSRAPLTTCPQDCNDRGFCSNTTCFCQSGWTGVTCAQKACENACYGRGMCDIITGICKCADPKRYTGPDCGQRLCQCGDRGDCDYNTGTCVNCKAGFYGPDCDWRCPGSATEICNGRGKCYEENGQHMCICDGGFEGKDCSNVPPPVRTYPASWAFSSVHSQCSDTKGFHAESTEGAGGWCALSEDPGQWLQANFEGNVKITEMMIQGRHKADHYPKVVHLEFYDKDKKISEKRDVPAVKDTSGTIERIFFDPPMGCNAARIVVVDHNAWPSLRVGFIASKVYCNHTTTGPNCDIERCYDDCTDRGTCGAGKVTNVDTGVIEDKLVCFCEPGWTGMGCQLKTCPGDCNYKGLCNNGTCVCDNLWGGDDCNTPVPSGCADTCKAPNGVCKGDTCYCSEGYTGTGCETATGSAAAAGGTTTAASAMALKASVAKLLSKTGVTKAQVAKGVEALSKCEPACAATGFCNQLHGTPTCLCEDGYGGPTCATKTES